MSIKECGWRRVVGVKPHILTLQPCSHMFHRILGPNKMLFSLYVPFLFSDWNFNQEKWRRVREALKGGPGVVDYILVLLRLLPGPSASRAWTW
jgi:hypothetical protein